MAVRVTGAEPLAVGHAAAPAFIPWARPTFFGDEQELVIDALKSTFISGGEYVERLEREFSGYHGMAGRGITVSNGTTALELALLGLGVAAGDEVIVPGWCFAAAANMVLARGATPVYVDVLPDTWLIDPELVEAAITPRTKVILPVHTYGNVCDMPRLCEIGARHDVAVIEDCAESLFSRYDGRLAGTWGSIGCFSFQATKTITTGEGGFVLAQDAQLCDDMRLIRNHGMRPSRKYWHEVVGYNFRLTNVQAAIGCAQFGHRETLVSMRRRMFESYRARLSDVPGVRLQHFSDRVTPVVWAVAIEIDPERIGHSRDALMVLLQERGIETRNGFCSFSEQPLYGAPPLRHSERLASNVISFPSPPDLTEEEIERICSELRSLLR